MAREGEARQALLEIFEFSLDSLAGDFPPGGGNTAFSFATPDWLLQDSLLYYILFAQTGSLCRLLGTIVFFMRKRLWDAEWEGWGCPDL